jgi:hypothetical protein
MCLMSHLDSTDMSHVPLDSADISHAPLDFADMSHVPLYSVKLFHVPCPTKTLLVQACPMSHLESGDVSNLDNTDVSCTWNQQKSSYYVYSVDISHILYIEGS